MFRYYVISTIIVLSVAVFATAWNHRELIHALIVPTKLAASPKPAPTENYAGRIASPFDGDLKWALSALPDCFVEATDTLGTLSYVRRHIPPGATAVATGTQLQFGSCTISVGNGEAEVIRGPDRLRIPPHVTFYQAGATLLLLRTTGTHGELRTYTTRN